MATPKSTDPVSVNESLILFRACEQGDLKTIEYHLNLLSTLDISLIRDEQYATLAHYAARYGHIHILRYFIENKNLNVSELRTEHGATCAHDAAVCDQVETLNYLFHYDQLNNRSTEDSTQKLRWSIRDQQGNTPLHLGKSRLKNMNLK